MLFRFKPPRDAEHSHPLEDCVSWWRDRRDNLLAYARLKAQTDLDAEDLLAESVKRIVRAVAENRVAPEPDELTPYAFTVIRNTAIDWRKKRSNRLNVEQAYVQDPTVREDAPFSLPEDTDHLHRELQKRLAQLPAELAEIIVMKIWSRLSFQEIATIIRCPKSTVDSRYRDALSRLRKMLRDNPITD